MYPVGGHIYAPPQRGIMFIALTVQIVSQFHSLQVEFDSSPSEINTGSSSIFTVSDMRHDNSNILDFRGISVNNTVVVKRLQRACSAWRIPADCTVLLNHVAIPL